MKLNISLFKSLPHRNVHFQHMISNFIYFPPAFYAIVTRFQNYIQFKSLVFLRLISSISHYNLYYFLSSFFFNSQSRTRKASITYQMEKKRTMNSKVLVHYLKGMILRMICFLMTMKMEPELLKLRVCLEILRYVLFVYSAGFSFHLCRLDS